jgi:hypothetical protein
MSSGNSNTNYGRSNPVYSRVRGEPLPQTPQTSQQTSQQAVNDARQPPSSSAPRLRPGPSESHPALLPRPSADDRHRDSRREARAEMVDDRDHDLADEMSSGNDAGDDAGASGAAGSSEGAPAAGIVAGAGTAKPVTACFNCRALRQKCDRKMPCSRCALRHRPCRYPSGSNRGRKHGNSL